VGGCVCGRRSATNLALAKNRPAASRLFEIELARAIEMIEAHPEIGRWARTRFPMPACQPGV
jgi:plasmid stabilization system protein ParE